MLRLPFVSSPAPTEWSQASKMVFDLANDLIEDPHWHPSNLYIPNQPNVPPATCLPNHLPFKAAKPLDIHLPPMPLAKVDGYIDDGCTITLDCPPLIKRAEAAIPLAIHAVFRPLSNNKPLP
eukprot:11939594-Ditylum_brightwellii.AAC.1